MNTPPLSVAQKIAVVQVYIHWVKDKEVNIQGNIDLNKLEKAYQIAKKSLTEAGITSLDGYTKINTWL